MLLNNQIILGLDISTKNTGWSIVKYHDNTQELIDYGFIPRGKMTIDEVLVNFENELIKIIDCWKPDVISAEAPFVGSNRQTIEKLCYVHGVMLLIAKKYNIPVTYYSVMTLKSKVLNGIKIKHEDGTKKTGKEMKMEVQQKIINIFGEDRFVKEYNDDVTDSISAAYTYILMDGKPVEKQSKKKHKK